MTAALVVVAWLLLAGGALAQELIMVPVTVDGQSVRLQMRIYQPAAPGPAPTLVFNHGSTGSGTDPAIMVRPIDFPVVAEFFVQRGWAVVMPARRGRGGSEGEYDEGFADHREAGYTCDVTRAVAGADRALRDIEAAMAVIVAMPFVDRTRVVIGGQSRGGILSVAYAGAHPEQVRGVINFVGGWSGHRCREYAVTNGTLFRRGAAYPGPMLWLYGEDDPFYSLLHSRANFEAFQAAGGTGSFHEFPRPSGATGHQISSVPGIWETLVERYLDQQRLPARRN
jgi:dienelactone hydrolase